MEAGGFRLCCSEWHQRAVAAFVFRPNSSQHMCRVILREIERTSHGKVMLKQICGSKPSRFGPLYHWEQRRVIELPHKYGR